MRFITRHTVTELDRAEKEFHRQYEMENKSAQIPTHNTQERCVRYV